MLKGGEVVGETVQLYAYAFRTDEGSLHYALIVPREHHVDMRGLAPEWGAEMAELYDRILALMPDDQPHNGYWNVGYAAGQRILNHWHIRIEPRFPGRPSSDMGLGLLVQTVDRLSE